MAALGKYMIKYICVILIIPIWATTGTTIDISSFEKKLKDLEARSLGVDFMQVSYLVSYHFVIQLTNGILCLMLIFRAALRCHAVNIEDRNAEFSTDTRC